MRRRCKRSRRRKLTMKTKIRVCIRLSLIFLFIFSLVSGGKFVFNKLFMNKSVSQITAINANIQAAGDPAKFTVCIDAGHGDDDKGTNISGVFEKNIALNVSLMVGGILEKNDIKVLYTRISDKTSLPSDIKGNLRKRVEISTKSKADVFVSIHCNGEKNTSFKGIETWCRFPNTDGEKLAKSIQSVLANSNYSLDRGLKYESDGSLAVLKP